MLIRGTTGDDCVQFRFEGGLSAREIDRSVGQGGVNLKPDVLKIQGLLNLIAPEDGGTAMPGNAPGGLKEDGFSGPKTIGAIKTFQIRQGTGSDGRVDPKGATLKRMNEVPKKNLAARNSTRLLRVIPAIPDLIAMAEKARLSAERAMDFVNFGETGLFSSKKSFDIANLHFAFGKQPKNVTVSELAFIRTTYTRVRDVLKTRISPFTGGSSFGVSIFTIDPMGFPFAAYSPTQQGDSQRIIPEVHSGLVFLCDGIDKFPPDKFTHVLFHELVHFVDDETNNRNIGDHGYRDKAMKLPHSLRMHNSDNYALFASHLHFGRERLVASQPELNPLIPENL
jgi:hypothetical protein